MASNSTNNFDLISQWRSQRLEFINRIADEALKNITEPQTSVSPSLRDLDQLLFRKLEAEGSISDNDSNSENGDDYGGTDDDNGSSFALPPQQLRIDSISRQLSTSSLMNTVADQAIHIKRTHSKIYSCFKDKDNGVMALKNNELAYIDCVRLNNGTRQLKMRIVSLDDSIAEVAEEDAQADENYQNGFRVVPFPNEIENMHAADMEYMPLKSLYIIGLYTSYQTNADGRAQRTSSLYLFDSTNNEFELWLHLSNPDENLGIVNRICCCSKKPVIYVVVNNFGRSGVLVLDQWGVILGRQYASDLISAYEKAHFVDIACTGNNDLLAIAYNSSVNGQEGHMGVRLYDPITWARIADLNLGLISVPFTVPRLAWINQLGMFALVNRVTGQMYVFNREAVITGQRSFIQNVEGFGPPQVSPINICAAERAWVAIRYTRFITVHRIID